MSEQTLIGPWDLDAIRAYLHEARIPVRLAGVASSGWPVVLSLWFLPEFDAIWCATARTAKIVSLLEADGRCGFEVASEEMPYRGVRGQARATIHPDRSTIVLQSLIDRYLENRESPLAKWLLSRADNEVAIKLEILRYQSWDFSNRMANETQ
jgi:hypothetical protein